METAKNVMNPVHPETRREEARLKLAKNGDAWGLYNALRDESSPNIKWDLEFARLFEALQRSACEDPDEFVEETFNHLLALSTFFLMRTHLFVDHRMRTCDQRGATAYPPGEAAGGNLARLMELGRYVAEIAQLRAATLRQTALARAKLPQSGRGVKKVKLPHHLTNGGAKNSASSTGNGHPHHEGLAGSPAQPSANGHHNGKVHGRVNGRPKPSHGPTNRLKDHLNGSSPP